VRTHEADAALDLLRPRLLEGGEESLGVPVDVGQVVLEGLESLSMPRRELRIGRVGTRHPGEHGGIGLRTVLRTDQRVAPIDPGVPLVP
jgi:hypothetical protein